MLDAEPALPTPDIPIDLEGPRPSPRHASNSVAIHTRGLSKRFPLRRTLPWRARKYVQALDGLDLDVAGGSIHGIIGPNGSGKSTLLRVLATLILPTAGEVLVHGLDVARHPDQVRRFIGFSTGEERSLYWRLTGRQNLEFFAALYHIGSRANAVSDALARLDLSEAADRPMMTYSQGMAQARPGPSAAAPTADPSSRRARQEPRPDVPRPAARASRGHARGARDNHSDGDA
jgi:ABC-type polysaccharide/polyol phosphate transport system ATPase subunit